MAGVVSPLVTDTSKMVLGPLLLRRMRLTSLGSTATATELPPEPYTTAGAEPRARRRRASFLPRPSRASATIVISLLILYLISLAHARGSVLPCPPLLSALSTEPRPSGSGPKQTTYSRFRPRESTGSPWPAA